MSAEASNNIDPLILAIENNELVLPTMPDWVIEIQKILDDINASTNQITLAIYKDPGLAGQLIKAANSAIYSSMPKAVDIMAAVTRLGHRLLHSMIMNITLARLANANHPVIQQHLSGFMDHSQEVAAISYVLAREQKHLMPDQAMLAGLIHDVGIIPIYMYADSNNAFIDEQDYDRVIQKYRGEIGEKLLRAWSFPEELVEVPAAIVNLQHGAESELSSYADIVTVANLLSRPTPETPAWDSVYARKRLGMSPEICMEFNESQGDYVKSVREIFFDSYL